MTCCASGSAGADRASLAAVGGEDDLDLVACLEHQVGIFPRRDVGAVDLHEHVIAGFLFGGEQLVHGQALTDLPLESVDDDSHVRKAA